MKKIFIVLAVMAALMFSVAPSQALVGMPDDVPGVNPLLPFFLVDKAGYSTSTGLDTLFVIQEVGGNTGTITQGKTKGQIHLIVRDKLSKDKGSTTRIYTPNDLVSFTVGDLIEECVGLDRLAELEQTINGKTYYTGYVNLYNSYGSGLVDNLVAFMYVIDLANGWAASTTAPVFEYTGNYSYTSQQKSTYTDDYLGITYTTEPFSPNAYAVSKSREAGNVVTTGTASSFRLMPRWYLKDLNAETFIPVWSSSIHTTKSTSYDFEVIAYIYDNDENMLNLPIQLPYEVNWLDVRGMLTKDWQSKTGGWINLRISNTSLAAGVRPYDSSWLAYSYQTASATGLASWSVLSAVHREVGTLE